MADRTEQVRIDLTANDEASKPIDNVADAADKLERKSPEVDVTADTSDADKGMGEVEATATRLEKNDVVIALRAQIEGLKADTKNAESALQDVSDKADDTNKHLDKIGGEGGLHTRGQAISDLTGPLGNASSAASDFAGVFDGIGDIAGDVATKVGLSAEAMETAIGGIGIFVAAAAAVWTLFKDKQEEARKKQAELVKGQQDFNKAVKEGNTAAAAAKFDELYGDGIDGAKQLKLSTKEAYDFIAGGVDSAKIDDAKSKLAELQTAFDAYQRTGQGDPSSFAGISNLQNQIQTLEAARSKFVEANGAEKDATDRAGELEAAIGGTGDAAKTAGEKTDTAGTKMGNAFDRAKARADLLKASIDDISGALDQRRAIEDFETDFVTMFDEIKNQHIAPTREEVRGLEDDIVRLGQTGALTPVEVQVLLGQIDAGDVDAAVAIAQRLANQADPVKIRATINFDDKSKRFLGGAYGFGPDGELIIKSSSASASSSTVVNINMPTGSRGVDVVRQVSGQTRRSGRRYGAPVVHYARR